MIDNYLSKKITILKSFLIILIVFNHSPTYKGSFETSPDDPFMHYCNTFTQAFIADGVSRIAVPLFFLISGFLFFQNFKPESKFFVTKIKKRSRTILIPYLLYSLICLIFYYIVHSIPSIASFFRAERLYTEYSLLELFYVWLISPVAGQLWFIRDLYMFVVLSPAIYWLLKKAGLTIILLVATAWFCIGSSGNSTDTLLACNTEGFLFFILGSYISILRYDVSKKIESPKLLLAAWVILLLIKTSFVVFNHQRYTELHRMTILVGLLAVWANYPMFESLIGKALLKISPYAFMIYLFHLPMALYFRRFVESVAGGSHIILLLCYFLVAICAIFVSLFLSVSLKKCLPSVYKLFSGGR